MTEQENRWQIHQWLAAQMDERLAWVTTIPKHILLIGADNDESRQRLAARYPQASLREYDPRADFLTQAARHRSTSLLAKLTGKTIPQTCQPLTAPLPEAQADMLWANLSLITALEPVPIFENWAHALKTHGLLFFTHLGGDSLPEMTSLLAEHNITFQAPNLLDMHDLGDMLFHHGFYDPVMDTAKLVLHYQHRTHFWQDMDTLGIWQALSFNDPTAAQHIINQRLAAGEWQITLETVFGHAIKKQTLPAGESVIQFYPTNRFPLDPPTHFNPSEDT